MITFKPISLLMVICLASAVVAGCHKSDGCNLLNPTPNAANTLVAPPTVVLQIVDKQNRDLFDPNTPNHYDSLTVAQLNTNKVYVAKSDGKHLLIMYYPGGEHTTIYSLSNTDQDTVYTNTQTIPTKCSSYQQLSEFKYNGKSYTDDLSTRRFVIVK